MGLFTKDKLTVRVSISRCWMTNEKKVLKAIQSKIKLNKEEKIYFKGTLSKESVHMFVSLKEYNTLAKSADKSGLFTVGRRDYHDREKGTDRKIR